MHTIKEKTKIYSMFREMHAQIKLIRNVVNLTENIRMSDQYVINIWNLIQDD